ncbi:MAG: DegV family protein [Lachnospiraceae bacterium]|nr:DegV family protein [Lachnospiraceae bacterium]
MSYKIVVDSSCEFPKEYQGDSRFEVIPFGLEVGTEHMTDDGSLDMKEFLAKIAACPTCPKSSCPSPERFMNAYNCDADDIYVVTISGNLSGCYQSAEVGKTMYLENFGAKNIHVVDSESASCGETQIALKLMELAESGMAFEEIVETITKFRDEMNTYFVLDNLETLRKNGRLTGVKALVASTLNIKPVMGAEKGVIIQRGQCIGNKKALVKMTDMIAAELVDGEKKVIYISQCNCPERAETVKKMLEQKTNCKAIVITEMDGLSGLYANDGGVIVAV